MSAGQVSAGFLFWAQRPQIAGMTATQKKQPIKRVDFPRSAMQNARFQFVDPVTFVGQLGTHEQV